VWEARLSAAFWMPVWVVAKMAILSAHIPLSTAAVSRELWDLAALAVAMLNNNGRRGSLYTAFICTTVKKILIPLQNNSTFIFHNILPSVVSAWWLRTF
jgi:hypothetical protein